jgi:hypothetical protein
MTVDVLLLPRSQSVALPSGLALETPLLIPSFSSRGFPFKVTGRTLRSTIREPLEVAQDWITDVLLVSAYDLSHGHLPNRGALSNNPPGSPYSLPALILIDSGSYEASEVLDLPDARRAAVEVLPWDPDRLVELIDSCESGLSAAIVNYDHYGPVDEQIALARAYFGRRPAYIHDFLLKPTERDRYLDVDNVVGHVARLRGFHIIGFTEKELASSLLDRMIAIARIRNALDGAGISAPIHVFGSLDPVLSPLYFLAGAEVFDGLSWLYMSYRQGISTYGDAAAALNSQWSAKVHQRRSVQLFENLTELTDLALSMRRFLSRQDFGEFRYHAPVFREARENLRAKLERQR